MGTVTNRVVSALAVGGAVAISTLTSAQQPQFHVLPVQGAVSMLSGAGANITLQAGKDGVLLVDTPPAALVPQLLAEIRKLSAKPIRYLVNTSLDAEHTGGNAALIGPAAGRGTGGAPFGTIGNNRPAIVAHENVLNRLSATQPPTPSKAYWHRLTSPSWPYSTAAPATATASASEEVSVLIQ